MRIGLTSSEVIKNRKEYGTNKLPEKKLKTGFQFFMETFQDRLNQILLAMMVVLALLAVFGQGSYSEPIGVAVVLLAIAFIGMYTGLKSQKNEKELKDRTSVRYCNVVRDGKVEHINANDLVVGDLVIIQSGESICADGFLVEGNLKVDNSVLNGESEECRKTPWGDAETDDPPISFGGKREANSNDYVDEYSLFSGTTVVDGEGKMIVTNVGVNTVNGQTIATIDEIEETKTSLEIQLEDLAGQISKFGYIGAIVIILALLVTNIIEVGGITEYFGIGWIGTLKNIMTIAVVAITIIVAAVPEGLPLIINLITAQNAKVMIKHNVLAKHTNKIPEAGNIQLLCTDKTGTLTVGKLVPVENVMGDGNPIAEGSMVDSLFKLNTVLNSSAMYDENGDVVGGNATERALLTLVSVSDATMIKESVVITNKKNFNSANKFSAVETNGKNGTITYYKGAPERLIDAAVSYQDENGVQPIEKDRLKIIVKSYATKAMRVIATAYSNSAMAEDGLPDDLILTSLVAIRDDVRPEVPEAVRKMHGAGVQVMMVTGDVIDTAKAIAKDAGLITSDSDIAMSAMDFDELSDEEAKAKLPYIKVIARATPKTKLRIVKLAQELGLCVGMTGDGTNDAPALKAADVGFSMGSGTDVCKEAGDIIITDDNFVSITDA
jgi:calcium-translocating P-type ATPase